MRSSRCRRGMQISRLPIGGLLLKSSVSTGMRAFVGNNRVVFNIKGNTYRVVVAIQHQFSIVYNRYVGTHEEYDRIDAAKV